MTGVDLDESTNWLAVFTPDLVDSTVNAVKDHLSDLGVPANALRVEERAVLTIPTPPAAPVRGATGRTRRSVPAGASPISEQRLDQGLNPFVGADKSCGIVPFAAQGSRWPSSIQTVITNGDS